jgi:hypothetical protein
MASTMAASLLYLAAAFTAGISIEGSFTTGASIAGSLTQAAFIMGAFMAEVFTEGALTEAADTAEAPSVNDTPTHHG